MTKTQIKSRFLIQEEWNAIEAQVFERIKKDDWLSHFVSRLKALLVGTYR